MLAQGDDEAPEEYETTQMLDLVDIGDIRYFKDNIDINKIQDMEKIEQDKSSKDSVDF